MVDQIEVKLSSEDKNDLKEKIAYQVALDRALAEASAPESTSSTPTARRGGGTGGILDTALGVATGMITVDLLKGILAQSQILSKVTDNILKAVGLAVDLVLLPFMPLIVWFLMGIYGFVKLMVPGGPLDPSKAVLPIGPLALKGLETLLDIQNAAREALLKGIQVILDGLVKWTSDIWRNFTDWIAGVSKQWDLLKAAWDDFWKGITWKNLEKWFTDVGKMFTDWWSGVGKQWEILKKIWDDFWKDINWDALTKWIDDIKKIFTDWVEGIGKQWEILVAGFKPILDWLQGFFSFDWLPKWIVDSFRPAGQSSTTTSSSTVQNNTINVSGLSIDQLNSFIDARLRQQGARYTQ
jgi:hypothetical protein